MRKRGAESATTQMCRMGAEDPVGISGHTPGGTNVMAAHVFIGEMKKLDGIHHISSITADAPGNVAFYAGVLGLRLVKKTVNQDDPTAVSYTHLTLPTIL